MKRLLVFLRILLVVITSAVMFTPNGVGLAQGGVQPSAVTAAGDELWGSQSALGVNDVVLAVVANATDVYVGGDLTIAGGNVAVSNIARFSLVTHRWYALGSGVNSRVYALALSGNTLYVGGIFTQAGSQAAQGIAQFNTVTQAWSTVGGSVLTPTNATTVYALTVDGAGHLYMGGHFTGVGSVSAMNVAMWNGSAWSALGNGLGDTTMHVYSLWASSSTDIYAGGDFTIFYIPYVSAGIAHWNGSAWSGLGGGTYNSTYKSVNAVAVSGSLVYIGGDFTQVDDFTSHAVNHFAVWNASSPSWSTLGGGMDASIYTLALDAVGHVYAGGQFNTADGMTEGKISVWNGSFWHVVSTTSAPGMDNDVAALYMQGNDLYAGGSFVVAGGYVANRVARWNITSQGWIGLGSTTNSVIYSLAKSGNTLYAGGYFIGAGGAPAAGVARWDVLANDWSPLADSLSGCTFNGCFTPFVLSVLAVGNDIYAGGSFTYAGGQYSVGIARYNIIDNKWHVLGSSGVNCTTLANCSATVYTMVYDGACIDVGGSFDTAGGINVGNLAVYCPASNTWGSLTWRDISGTYNINTDNLVTSLALDNYGDLYIGGAFSSPAARLFYTDGYGVYGVSTDALNGVVNAILPVGNDLYIGGAFTNIQGSSGFNYLAKLPSGQSHYVQVGGSLNGVVYALDWWKNKLVVGGDFTLEGGLLGLSHIGLWDGSAWSALGSGTDQIVDTLAVDPNFIYAGGSFNTAGGKTANYFDSWGQYQELLPVLFK